MERSRTCDCFCDTTDHGAIEEEVARGCNLLYLETPTNPTLKLVDIKRLSEAGALVVVDSTFATTINQSALTLGADLVLHSASKYLGGHSDALGGLLCGQRQLVRRVYHYRQINGAALAPFAAAWYVPAPSQPEDPRAARRASQRERC